MEEKFIPLWERRRLKLTKRMKEYLYYKNRNYKHAEIAKILGLKVSSVHSISFQTKQRLKNIRDHKEISKM